MGYERTYLGEDAVYPGHPVTIAYCIVDQYESWEAASFCRDDSHICEALGDSAIPGAGGCVSAAIAHLKRLYVEKTDPEVVFQMMDDTWDRTDNHSDTAKYFNRWQAGQKQANNFKPRLIKKLKEKWGY
jgi:hypothetical protein